MAINKLMRMMVLIAVSLSLMLTIGALTSQDGTPADNSVTAGSNVRVTIPAQVSPATDVQCYLVDDSGQTIQWYTITTAAGEITVTVSHAGLNTYYQYAENATLVGQFTIFGESTFDPIIYAIFPFIVGAGIAMAIFELIDKIMS